MALERSSKPPATWEPLHFLLVPDAGAARRVRRLLAEQGARLGLIAGSWPELIDWSHRAYIVPQPGDDWERALTQALAQIGDAFWSASLAVAPDETAEVVCSALAAVLSATDPGADLEIASLAGLPPRPRRHLGDLLRLSRALAGRLPQELASIRDLLSAPAERALHVIRVHHLDDFPALSRWQAALIDKLNRDAAGPGTGGEPDAPRNAVLKRLLTADPAAGARGALGVLQSRLFTASHDTAELDPSVQWVGVRDFLQEAEVAAGMAQRLLTAHPELAPADIGLLVPDSFEYAVAVEDAFRLGGLALSGLPVERWRRDLGREAVFHFLYCRQKPAPAMALAVCLASPLMPWAREQGAMLAQAVMDGDYGLGASASAGADARAMLDLLRGADEEPASLIRALDAFVALLNGGDALAGHLHQARAAVERIRALLEGAAQLDWIALRRAAAPRFVSSGESPDFNLEGITVWRESQEPWRPVRHLLVLGFAQAHYPPAVPGNPVFTAAEIEAIRRHLALPLSTPGEDVARRRQRFVRQLSAASRSVTFLVPRRDAKGAVQPPSDSLVFMHRLFSGADSADERIVELDAAQERARAHYLALAASEQPRAPRVLSADDLHFGRNLLAVRGGAHGGPRPESPSSLETLMVSPLAWLLRRLAAEPLLWAPESADAALLGTLAHRVFEGLFGADQPLPSREAIAARAEALLGAAIRRLAPFLSGPQWQVERRHFAAQTIRAAQTWRDVLERLGAEVLASEARLQGTWSGITVRGQTDAILGLSGERLLIVDYKRSKSASRRVRMDKGYDSQASLYRAMLQNGGLEVCDDAPLAPARLRRGVPAGIVYYMLNDQVCLSDSALPESDAVPGWQAVEQDVAANAMTLIRQRLAEVREGVLKLNRDGDAAFFEKHAGVKPYALDNSPLIGLFAAPSDAREVT